MGFFGEKNYFTITPSVDTHTHTHIYICTRALTELIAILYRLYRSGKATVAAVDLDNAYTVVNTYSVLYFTIVVIL